MAALGRYADLPVEGLPLEFLQNKEPKLLAKDLLPVSYPRTRTWSGAHPDTATSTPRSAARADRPDGRAGLPAGVRLQLRQPRRHSRPARGRLVGQRGAPFAIEAVRRTPSDRKGGHFARRKADGRIVLRETAQTLDADKPALADLDRHRYCSTNNLWFDLAAMKLAIDSRDGILGLPLIRNVKTVDPADKSTPKVVQIETAMGAAIEIFQGARTIEVGRDRFVPVKTTNDLLVLRSDVYDLGKDFVLDQAGEEIPFVELDGEYYKLVGDFDKRFPEGAPSMKTATSLDDRRRLDLRPRRGGDGRCQTRAQAWRAADPGRCRARGRTRTA